MICRYGGQAVLTVAVLFLFLLHGGRLLAADSAVTGVVEKSGYSGVVLKGVPGARAVKYQTGRKTVFSPRDYRPAKGDTVTIRYYRQVRNNGRVALLATAVTLVNRAPARAELSSPAVGIVRALGRKRIRFEFPGSGQLTMEMKRGMQRVPAAWRPAVGDRVRVYYEKVPARFVRKMVLVISRIERIDGARGAPGAGRRRAGAAGDGPVAGGEGREGAGA